MAPSDMPRPQVKELLHPVNGIVQPPVYAHPKRPGRRTNVLDSLKPLVSAIWRKSWAFHFHHPVNSIALGVPNYHTVIKRPMDLNTIKHRLAFNYYYQADEAIEDFKHIIDNCLLFNLEGTEVHTAGLMLKSFFYERLALIDLTNEVEVVEKPKAKKRKKATFEPRRAKTPAKKANSGKKF